MAAKTKGKKKIKLALIGAGNMANKVHYPSLADFKDVEMAAICDLVDEKLNATADKFKIKKRYNDYKKMLDEVKPDAVYILMPPHHMYHIQVECLDRGLHMFVEKPAAATTYQVKNLARLAQKNKCLTMVGLQRRYCPLLNKVRKEVEKKGPIIQCLSRFVKFNIDKPNAYYQHAVDILRMDAIHALDTLLWMGGKVDGFSADVASFYDDIPNAFNVLVKFKNGAVGFLLTNWAVGRRIFNVEMHAKGITAFADPEGDAVIYADGKNDPAMELTTQQAAKSEEWHQFAGYYAENRHFIDCLKKGKQPDTNFANAVETMELIDEIYGCII